MREKITVLLIALCIAFGNTFYAQSENFWKNKKLTLFIKSVISAKDANIYYIDNSLSKPEVTIGQTEKVTLSYFVDAEPNKGWQHDCYVVKIMTDKFGRSLSILSVQEQKMPPRNANLIPVDIQNPYGDNANSLPVVSKSQNAYYQNPAANRTYALIISGGVSKSTNYDRYWNDCSFVYQTLVNKYGIPKSNIYPIMSDGTDPAADMINLSDGTYKSQPLDLDFDGTDDIKYAATKANVQSVLSTLSGKMGKDDHLFIYVIDHGGTDDNNMRSFIWLWNYGKLYDNELAEMLTPFTYKLVNVNVVLGQCFSGGFIDDLTKVGCVVTAASRGDESSYACSDIPYDEFVYHWTCAINGANHEGAVVSADSDFNSRVTMKEAFDYAKANDRVSYEHPQYNSTPASVGDDLAFNNLVPGVDLYIKDNWDDTGKEPNLTTGYFWMSPSIWCRNQDDGIEQHQNPEYSSDHQFAYIYVKIYNRGKEKFEGGKWLHVYWSRASTVVSTRTWKGRELYNGTDVTGGVLEAKNIPPLESGDSVIVRLPWALPHMLADYPDDDLHFCLLAKIMDLPYDDGYEDGKSYFDTRGSNDQAQKNLIITTRTELRKAFNVFVRNTSDATKSYSLELVPRTNADKELLSKATVMVGMSPTVYSAWQRGGSKYKGMSMVNGNSAANVVKYFRYTSVDNKLDRIVLAGQEFDKVTMKVSFNIANMKGPETYTWDLIQKDQYGHIVGGETFMIEPSEVASQNLPVLTNPTYNGDLELSVGDGGYSQIMWQNGDGEDIGEGEEIVITPSRNNDLVAVAALNDEGEVATGSISLVSEYGIKSVRKVSENMIEVELQNGALQGSSLKVTSALDGAMKSQQDLSEGVLTVRFDTSSFAPGLYIVSYEVNNNIINSSKFNK